MKKMDNSSNDKELYKPISVKRAHLPLGGFWSFQKFIPTELQIRFIHPNIVCSKEIIILSITAASVFVI